MSELHSARVLAILISELRGLRVIGESGADALAVIAMPDASWGNNPPLLRSAVRQAVRPRVFAQEARAEHGKEAGDE